jgi:hypothetical protein
MSDTLGAIATQYNASEPYLHPAVVPGYAPNTFIVSIKKIDACMRGVIMIATRF